MSFVGSLSYIWIHPHLFIPCYHSSHYCALNGPLKHTHNLLLPIRACLDLIHSPWGNHWSLLALLNAFISPQVTRCVSYSKYLTHLRVIVHYVPYCPIQHHLLPLSHHMFYTTVSCFISAPLLCCALLTAKFRISLSSTYIFVPPLHFLV